MVSQLPDDKQDKLNKVFDYGGFVDNYMGSYLDVEQVDDDSQRAKELRRASSLQKLNNSVQRFPAQSLEVQGANSRNMHSELSFSYNPQDATVDKPDGTGSETLGSLVQRNVAAANKLAGRDAVSIVNDMEDGQVQSLWDDQNKRGVIRLRYHNEDGTYRDQDLSHVDIEGSERGTIFANNSNKSSGGFSPQASTQIKWDDDGSPIVQGIRSASENLARAIRQPTGMLGGSQSLIDNYDDGGSNWLRYGGLSKSQAVDARDSITLPNRRPDGSRIYSSEQYQVMGQLSDSAEFGTEGVQYTSRGKQNRAQNRNTYLGAIAFQQSRGDGVENDVVGLASAKRERQTAQTRGIAEVHFGAVNNIAEVTRAGLQWGRRARTEGYAFNSDIMQQTGAMSEGAMWIDPRAGFTANRSNFSVQGDVSHLVGENTLFTSKDVSATDLPGVTDNTFIRNDEIPEELRGAYDPGNNMGSLFSRVKYNEDTDQTEFTVRQMNNLADSEFKDSLKSYAQGIHTNQHSMTSHREGVQAFFNAPSQKDMRRIAMEAFSVDSNVSPSERMGHIYNEAQNQGINKEGFSELFQGGTHIPEQYTELASEAALSYFKGTFFTDRSENVPLDSNALQGNVEWEQNERIRLAQEVAGKDSFAGLNRDEQIQHSMSVLPNDVFENDKQLSAALGGRTLGAGEGARFFGMERDARGVPQTQYNEEWGYHSANLRYARSNVDMLFNPLAVTTSGKWRGDAEQLDTMFETDPKAAGRLVSRMNNGEFQNPSLDIVTAARSNTDERVRNGIDYLDLSDREASAGFFNRYGELSANVAGEMEGVSANELRHETLRRMAKDEEFGGRNLQIAGRQFTSLKSGLSYYSTLENGKEVPGYGAALVGAVDTARDRHRGTDTEEILARTAETANKAFTELVGDNDKVVGLANREGVLRKAAQMEVKAFTGGASGLPSDNAMGVVRQRELASKIMQSSISDDEKKQATQMMRDGNLRGLHARFPQANSGRGFLNVGLRTDEQMANSGLSAFAALRRQGVYTGNVVMQNQAGDYDADLNMLSPDFGAGKRDNVPSRDAMLTETENDPGGERKGIRDKIIGGGIGDALAPYGKDIKTLSAQNDAVRSGGESAAEMGMSYNPWVRQAARTAKQFLDEKGIAQDHPMRREAMFGMGNQGQQIYQLALDLDPSKSPYTRALQRSLGEHGARLTPMSDSFYKESQDDPIYQELATSTRLGEAGMSARFAKVASRMNIGHTDNPDDNDEIFNRLARNQSVAMMQTGRLTGDNAEQSIQSGIGFLQDVRSGKFEGDYDSEKAGFEQAFGYKPSEFLALKEGQDSQSILGSVFESSIARNTLTDVQKRREENEERIQKGWKPKATYDHLENNRHIQHIASRTNLNTRATKARYGKNLSEQLSGLEGAGRYKSTAPGHAAFRDRMNLSFGDKFMNPREFANFAQQNQATVQGLMAQSDLQSIAPNAEIPYVGDMPEIDNMSFSDEPPPMSMKQLEASYTDGSSSEPLPLSFGSSDTPDSPRFEPQGNSGGQGKGIPAQQKDDLSQIASTNARIGGHPSMPTENVRPASQALDNSLRELSQNAPPPTPVGASGGGFMGGGNNVTAAMNADNPDNGGSGIGSMVNQGETNIYTKTLNQKQVQAADLSTGRVGGAAASQNLMLTDFMPMIRDAGGDLNKLPTNVLEVFKTRAGDITGAKRAYDINKQLSDEGLAPKGFGERDFEQQFLGENAVAFQDMLQGTGNFKDVGGLYDLSAQAAGIVTTRKTRDKIAGAQTSAINGQALSQGVAGTEHIKNTIGELDELTEAFKNVSKVTRENVSDAQGFVKAHKGMSEAVENITSRMEQGQDVSKREKKFIDALGGIDKAREAVDGTKNSATVLEQGLARNQYVNRGESEEERRMRLQEMMIRGGPAGERMRRSKRFTELAENDGFEFMGMEFKGEGSARAAGRLQRGARGVKGMASSAMRAKYMLGQPLMGAAQHYEERQVKFEQMLLQSGSMSFDDAMSGAMGQRHRRRTNSDLFQTGAGSQIYNAGSAAMGMFGSDAESAGRTAGLLGTIGGATAAGAMMGSSFGPWGAAIGGGAGFTIGTGVAIAGASKDTQAQIDYSRGYDENVRDSEGNETGIWDRVKYNASNFGEMVSYGFGGNENQQNSTMIGRSLDEWEASGQSISEFVDSGALGETSESDFRMYATNERVRAMHDRGGSYDQALANVDFETKFSQGTTRQERGWAARETVAAQGQGIDPHALALAANSVSPTLASATDETGRTAAFMAQDSVLNQLRSVNTEDRPLEQIRMDNSIQKVGAINPALRRSGMDALEWNAFTTGGTYGDYKDNTDAQQALTGAMSVQAGMRFSDPLFSGATSDSYLQNTESFMPGILAGDNNALYSSGMYNQNRQQVAGLTRNFGLFNDAESTNAFSQQLDSMAFDMADDPQRFGQFMATASGNKYALAQNWRGLGDVRYQSTDYETGLGAFEQNISAMEAAQIGSTDKYGRFNMSAEQMAGGTRGLREEQRQMGIEQREYSYDYQQDSRQLGVALQYGVTQASGIQLDDKGFVPVEINDASFDKFKTMFQEFGLGEFNAGDGRTTAQVEDSQVRMQREQQELGRTHGQTNLDLQRQRFALAGEQFYEKFGLSERKFEYNTQYQRGQMDFQRTQQLTQRSWQYEDQSFNRSKSELNYGWQMEDSDRNLRYARGMQRRTLMLQQERNTISHSMDMGRMDRDENRLDIRSDWNDTQYGRQRGNFEQGVSFQQESMDMQVKHFEQGRELDAQRLRMQEEQFMKQGQWLDEQWANEDQLRLLKRESSQLELARAEEQWAFNLSMAEKSQEINDNLSVLNETMGDWNAFVDQSAQKGKLAAAAANMFSDGMNEIPQSLKVAEEAINQLMQQTSGATSGALSSVSNYISQMTARMNMSLNDSISSMMTSAQSTISGIMSNISSRQQATSTTSQWSSGAYSSFGSGSTAPSTTQLSDVQNAIRNTISSGVTWLNNRFDEGGFTGEGNKTAPAGIVHKGEYVVPQSGALVVRGESESDKTLKEIKDLMQRLVDMGIYSVSAEIYTNDSSMKASALNPYDMVWQS